MSKAQPLKKGTTVSFRPEWSEPGDEGITFIVCEDEVDGWVGVMAMVNLPLKPWSRYPVSYLNEGIPE